MKPIKIGYIGNYYGGLYILEHDKEYYWIIEDYDTDFNDLSQYCEITETLYNELLKYETK